MMKAEELQAIRDRCKQNSGEQFEAGVMHSGCTDYACYCHYDLPKVLDELDRLKASMQKALNLSYLVDMPLANGTAAKALFLIRKELEHCNE